MAEEAVVAIEGDGVVDVVVVVFCATELKNGGIGAKNE